MNDHNKTPEQTEYDHCDRLAFSKQQLLPSEVRTMLIHERARVREEAWFFVSTHLSD